MKTFIRAALAATVVFSVIPGLSQAQSISKDEYRDRVVVLFGEFQQMKKDGVFLDQTTIKAYGSDYKFSNTIRGDNPPGGFFARPPGSEWLKRVEQLGDTGHKFVCFSIPTLPSGAGICGFDLMSLNTGLGDIDFLDSVAARFWLATICHESPEACAAHIAD